MKKQDCFVCFKENLSKDEIGLNKKLISKKATKLYCIDCLADYFGVSSDDLKAKIEEFKEQGCTLF